MKTNFQRTLVALALAGAASCVAYGQNPYPPPPGAPPGYGSQPGYSNQPGYQPGYGDDRYGGRYGDPYGSPDMEVGFFYQELSPYGDWIYTYEYGWTWLPRDVAFGWRPYSYGRWVMSDFGWFWVSYEPFGWATYHYGRWTMHPRFGWIWCPGSTWGPSWVSWQYGQGYVGWAPLPPEVGFEVGIGLRLGGLSLSVLLQPSSYTFVDERRFLDPDLDRHYLPSARNVTIIKNTTNITNYTYVDNRVINRGVDTQFVERATGRKVTRMRVAETEVKKSEAVRGDELVVYKPPRQRIETVKVDENKPGRGRPERKASQPERPEGRERTERSQPAEKNAPERPQATEKSGSQRPQTEAKGEVQVAPRVQPAPPQREERVKQHEQKERQELEAFERAERQRLEKAQREEREKPKAQADAAAINRRQAEEKKALEEELKRSKQHLEGRQAVEREAVQAKPPGQQKADEKKANEKKSEQQTVDEKKAEAQTADEKKAAPQTAEEKKAAAKKAAEKKEQEKKDAAKKKKAQADEPPPPRR